MHRCFRWYLLEMALEDIGQCFYDEILLVLSRCPNSAIYMVCYFQWVFPEFCGEQVLVDAV